MTVLIYIFFLGNYFILRLLDSDALYSDTGLAFFREDKGDPKRIWLLILLFKWATDSREPETVYGIRTMAWPSPDI